MSKPRRNTNPQPALTPDFSQPVPRSAPPAPPAPDHYESMAAELIRLRTEIKEQKKLTAGERKRHAGTEALTLRLVAQLEQQVQDLRSVVFKNLGRQFVAVPFTQPKEKK